jgi:hypothetical protein
MFSVLARTAGYGRLAAQQQKQKQGKRSRAAAGDGSANWKKCLGVMTGHAI